MINVYGCGGALVSGTIPPHCSKSHCPHSWCNRLGAIAYDSQSTLIVMRETLKGQRCVDGLRGVIILQDNAPHAARVAQDFLRHFHTLRFYGQPVSPICYL
ncbi:hypothetical protein TNCV_3471461 [Trichonephila clavipes]|nr:hypothetical protein TNCV_3471461 [Trichonephila clavipes]